MPASVHSGSYSLDALMGLISRVVAERYRERRLPTNGAWLADVIRHELPSFSYEQVGLARLSDAVALAERQGLVVRSKAVKHLEVFPANVLSVPESLPVRSRALDRTVAPHIRPDVWRAFVYVTQDESYFFDRQSGNILTSSQVGTNSDESRFARVDTIPLSVQQEWMLEFVRAESQLDVDMAPINDQYCFVRFPQWLRDHQPGLEQTWKQYRVHQIAERIRAWANRNSIDVSEFFSMPAAFAKARTVEGSFASDEKAIRAAIVMAANELPVENLKDIAIPIRYVLRALQSP